MCDLCAAKVRLGQAALDMAALFSQRQILLSTVPVGSARVVFSGSQFGGFLIHPLMLEAASTAVQVWSPADA